jgi:hypothetical protein
MDEMTACELADVQNRWHENGNPQMGYLGGDSPSWFSKTMYAITGDDSWFGTVKNKAAVEASKVNKVLQEALKTPPILPEPKKTGISAADLAMAQLRILQDTEEKAVEDKKKQDVTDKAQAQATAPTNAVDCAKRGGVWDENLLMCRSKTFFEKEEVRRVAPWVAVGVVSLGLFVLLLKRR